MISIQNIAIVVLAGISAVLAAESYYPTNSKFFYMELTHEENEANVNKSTYYLELNLQDRSHSGGMRTFKLIPTGNEQGIELTSTECNECTVFNSKVETIAPSARCIKKDPSGVDINGQDVYQISKNQLYGNTFQMTQYLGTFSSQLHTYHRQVDYGEAVFNLINSCTLSWAKDQTYSYFGFQPYWYPNVGQEKASNFLRQMQNKGLLSSITISFDIRSEFGRSSYVKFGGMDTFALADGKLSSMKLFKTNSIDEWSIPLNNIKDCEGKVIFNDQGQSVHFDPGVKYIYVPANRQNDIANGIMKSMNLPDNTQIDCSSTSVCNFDASCDTLRTMNPNTTSFDFVFTDDQGEIITYKMPAWRLLVDPKKINMNDEKYNGKCFFGVFKSNINQANTLIVGYEFFKEYYMMFDASPQQEYRQAYIQVGIGARNKNVDIGQVRYQTNYPGYIRANKSDDVSTIMDGFKDQYDEEIKPDDNIDPTYNDDPDHPNQPNKDGGKSSEALWIIIIVLCLIIVLGACSVFMKRRDQKLTQDLDQQNKAKEEEKGLMDE